jgi:protein TonB
MSATHWRLTYPNNLKRAYFVTVGLTVIVLLLAFGYVKGKDILASRHVAATKGRTVTFTYAQLGPPPSLTGEEITATAANAATPSAPTVGIPKPVPDAEATAETSTPQAELGGSSPLTGVGTGTVVVQVDTSIPPPGTYIPHNVNPQVVTPGYLQYPEGPKLLGIEGNAFVWCYLDIDGAVLKVAIAKGTGNAALDSAAAETAWKTKFSPARQNDKPVKVWVSLPVKFNLENR